MGSSAPCALRGARQASFVETAQLEIKPFKSKTQRKDPSHTFTGEKAEEEAVSESGYVSRPLSTGVGKRNEERNESGGRRE